MPRKPRRYLLLIFFVFVFLPGLSFALESGSLDISSRPLGAAVYLDDTRIGETNTVINAIPVGSHKLRLELVGYEKVEQMVSVRSGRTTRIPNVLVRLKGMPLSRGKALRLLCRSSSPSSSIRG